MARGTCFRGFDGASRNQSIFRASRMPNGHQLFGLSPDETLTNNQRPPFDSTPTAQPPTCLLDSFHMPYESLSSTQQTLHAGALAEWPPPASIRHCTSLSTSGPHLSAGDWKEALWKCAKDQSRNAHLPCITVDFDAAKGRRQAGQVEVAARGPDDTYPLGSFSP